MRLVWIAAAVIGVANSFTIEGSLVSNPKLPGSSSVFPHSTLIKLFDTDGQVHTQSYITATGQFALHDVSADASYMLSVTGNKAYRYPTLRIDTKADDTFEAFVPDRTYNWSSPSAPTVATHPLLIAPLEQCIYYSSRPSFNLIGLLKNPMVAMIIFSVGMMYVIQNFKVSYELTTIRYAIPKITASIGKCLRPSFYLLLKNHPQIQKTSASIKRDKRVVVVKNLESKQRQVVS